MRQLTRHDDKNEIVKSWIHSSDTTFGEMTYRDWCAEEIHRLRSVATSSGDKSRYFVKEDKEGISIWTTAEAPLTEQEQDLEALRVKNETLGSRI